MAIDDERPDASHELRAASDDPWLKVHVLSEFVFCPRAGIVAFETKLDDTGVEDDDPRANVNYMPFLEIPTLIQAIERTTQSLIRWLPVPAVSLVVTVVGGWWLGWCPAVVGILLTMGLLKPVFVALEDIRKLKELLDHAQTRNPREPDPNDPADQGVEWWELIKADFESYPPPRSFNDEDIHLAGRPRHILRRGKLLIPVFQKKMTGADPETMRPQHRARVAAYCHLVQQAGFESPYGIVLYGIPPESLDSRARFCSHVFRGKAVNSAAAWDNFRDGVLLARQTVQDFRSGVVPSAPDSERCKGCPHGKPYATTRRSAASQSDSVLSVPLLIAKGADGREYHSECGDRFNWIPPHEKALKKELKSS